MDDDRVGWGQPLSRPSWEPPGSPWRPPTQPRSQGPSPRAFLLFSAALALAILAGVGLGAALAISSAPPIASSAAATRVFGTSLAAADAQEGFHYRSVSQSPLQTFTITGDAGSNTGIQHLNLDGHRFTLVFESGTVYCQADAAILQNQLGLSPSVAAANANKWISVSPGDTPYASLEPGITSHSALSQLALVPQRVVEIRFADGTAGSRVTGGLPARRGQQAGGTATLEVANASHLPVKYASEQGRQGSAVITFTSWGEHVSQAAPPGAIPYSSVAGGGGPISPSAPTIPSAFVLSA